MGMVRSFRWVPSGRPAPARGPRTRLLYAAAARFPAGGQGRMVRSGWNRGEGTEYRVPSTQYLVPSTERALIVASRPQARTGHASVFRTEYWVLGTSSPR